MTESKDWERWQAEWQHSTMPDSEVTHRPSITAAQRRGILIPLIEGLLAGTALLINVLALKHAANALEMVLGIAVSGAIGLAWIRRILIRRNEDSAATESSADYLKALLDVRTQEVRLAHFIWVVIPLELAFLIPWWVIGSRFHHRHITDVTSWLPILVIFAVIVGSIRMRRRALEEIDAIKRINSQL